jgi:23S rRNA maturation mini-RNase III
VERKILNILNVSYVHLSELPVNQRTCLQQLYSKKFNNLRTNVMRGGAAIQHTSMIKKEQPKMSDMFKKNFKRGKTTFFATNNIQDNEAWQKVSRL